MRPTEVAPGPPGLVPAPMAVEALAARKRSSYWIGTLLDYGLYVALAGLVVYFAIGSPYFLTPENLFNVGQAVAILGILAAGMTVVLIAGQLDLSMGPMIGLISVLIAVLLRGHVPLGGAIAVALAVGMVVGATNSVLAIGLGINSIIATLASGTVITGAAYLLSGGQDILIRNPGPLTLVDSRPFGVPVLVVVLIIVYVAGYVVLRHLRFGWQVYAVGGNPSAASRAGIRTARTYLSVFMLSSTLATFAGILTVARTLGGDAGYGGTAIIDVLTAVLLGGIRLSGGAGKIQRTLVGVLIIGVLSNGLVLMDVQSYFQQLVKGIVFVLAVVVDALRAKRSSR